MNCFPCFGGGDKKKKDESSSGSSRGSANKKNGSSKHKNPTDLPKVDSNNGHIAAQTFTFRELATATKNFNPECLLGEGGFGRVYKGSLPNTGQLVAIKQLDRNGLHGNKEFLVEVMMLSLLHHPNLVNLIGYCADGDQRLLVYEYMPSGSLEDHLLDLKPDQKPLCWYTRMKIASGAAQGLEYLHDKANPPIIFRDLKSSNILLDEVLNPKFSDYGLDKLSPSDKMHLSSRMMGSYGYCAPEYDRGGELTLKSDIYSFGVVLLELITGRRALDTSKPINEQNLVAWAQPMFRDQKRFPELVDPLLQDNYPAKCLNQAVGVAAMCLQEEAEVRPLIGDVVVALSFLVGPPPTPQVCPAPSVNHSSPTEIQPEGDQPRSSDSDSSVDSSHHSSSKRSQGSKHSSRHWSRSSSKRSSRHGSSQYGSDRKGSSHHLSDTGSSSKHSKRLSRRGSNGSSSSSSKHSRGSSRHGSDVSDSDRYHDESPHGSYRSVSNGGSEHGPGSAMSMTRHSFEHEGELM